MKLWPFSKKTAAEGALDRNMDLPPGVVLAAPDEPPPQNLPIINAKTAPAPDAPLVDPAAGLEIDQHSPELEQLFGPGGMPNVAATGHSAEPMDSPDVSPMNTLPSDLPDLLFSDSAATLWMPPTSEANLISPLESSSEPMAKPTTWESLGPSEPLPDMAPPALSMPMNEAAIEPAMGTAALPMADTYQPAEPMATPPVDMLPSMDSAMLPPEPQISESMSAYSAPPSIESVAPMPLESAYYQPEAAETPLDTARFDPDPMPLDGMAPSLDIPSAIEMSDMAAFLPPIEEAMPALDYAMENLAPLAEPSSNMDDLLAEAEMMTTAHPIEESYLSQEPLPYTETAPDMMEASVAEPMGDQSFFASASFDAMDGFGQVNGHSGLFMPEDTMQAIASDEQNDLYLPPDAEFDSLNAQLHSKTQPEPVYSAEAYSPEDYNIGEYTPGEYTPGESISEEDTLTAAALETMAQSMDEYTMTDMDDMGSFDEGDEVGDLQSYDMGHYDDPDAPTEAFVLGSDDLEPILSLDLETTPPISPEPESHLSAQSAQYYPHHEALAEAPASPMCHEQDIAHAPFEAALPEVMPEDIADHRMSGMPEMEPAPNEPAIQPMPQKHHPMTAALAAANEPEPPRPIPAQPVPQRANPIQESAFRKSNHSNTPYSDSIADALQSFEQEVLLRDTRFLKQSINNLVERYFAQSEPENEW